MSVYKTKTRQQKQERVNQLRACILQEHINEIPADKQTAAQNRLVIELAMLEAQLKSPDLVAAEVSISCLFGGNPMYRIMTICSNEKDERDYCELAGMITVKMSDGRVRVLDEKRQSRVIGKIIGTVQSAIAAGLSWENSKAVIVPFKI